MLETSSRLHTIVYACLLSVVVICGSVQLSAFVSTSFDLTGSSNLVVLSAIVTAILAPPVSFLLASYSNKLIRVQEKLYALATTDPLTGLLNRRAFEALYDRESARSARKNQPISLLMLDLDYFKDINNRHGHPGGDVALRALANCLRKSVRFGSDEIARWGGEEFAILLTDTGRETAIRAALRYRQKVESLD
ncbi:MAG: GGDEF domain-containing protein, partial [Henriciella sp.]|nr:GGDEF domain-containing protein [Henriciella sp.]